MATGKSNYLEAALLKAVLAGAAYTSPGTVYVALSSAAWSSASTGSSMSELSGGAYARQSISAVSGSWTQSGTDPTQLANVNAITFPTATANWSAILSVYLVDAASGGNVLWGTDVTSTTVNSGQQLSIAASSLVVKET